MGHPARRKSCVHPDPQPAWLADPQALLDSGIDAGLLETKEPLAPRAEAPPPLTRSPDPYSWSQLLRRVFSLDVLRCSRCVGRRELISLITDPPVIRRILRHRGLDPDPLAPARPRPQMDFDFEA